MKLLFKTLFQHSLYYNMEIIILQTFTLGYGSPLVHRNVTKCSEEDER